MIHRPINSILYCNKFVVKGSELYDEPKPLDGRVYTSYFNESLGRYHINIPTSDPEVFVGYVFENLKGDNEYWTWDFTKIDKENIDTLIITDEDIVLIDNFIAGDRGQITTLPIEELPTTSHPAYEEHFEDEVDESVSKIMSMVRDELNRAKDSFKAMNTIMAYDKDMGHTIQDLLIYIASTYKDRVNSPISAEGFFYGKDGLGFNVGNAVRHLADYSGTDHNPKDLVKAVQYLLFELTRRNIQQ